MKRVRMKLRTFHNPCFISRYIQGTVDPPLQPVENPSLNMREIKPLQTESPLLQLPAKKGKLYFNAHEPHNSYCSLAGTSYYLLDTYMCESVVCHLVQTEGKSA